MSPTVIIMIKLAAKFILVQIVLTVISFHSILNFKYPQNGQTHVKVL